MVYVLDSNILMSSCRTHFSFLEKTGFWEWLVNLGQKNLLIVPESVYEETGKGNDKLPEWLAQHKSLFWKPSSSCRKEFAQVIQAYESIWGKPSLEQLDKLNADPYVIAHALAVQGTVVTNEVRNHSAKDVKIPNVCDKLSLPCITLPRFLWDLRNNLPH